MKEALDGKDNAELHCHRQRTENRIELCLHRTAEPRETLEKEGFLEQIIVIVGKMS